MQKDFDGWSVKKKILNEGTRIEFYRPRDIWWCALGTNIGFEQDGKDKDFLRPVLIIKGLSKETCIIVPLTTSNNKNKYRIAIGIIDEKERKVILSQIRVIDTKRLVDKICELDKQTFEIIRKTIRILF